MAQTGARRPTKGRFKKLTKKPQARTNERVNWVTNAIRSVERAEKVNTQRLKNEEVPRSLAETHCDLCNTKGEIFFVPTGAAGSITWCTACNQECSEKTKAIINLTTADHKRRTIGIAMDNINDRGQQDKRICQWEPGVQNRRALTQTRQVKCL